MKRAVILIGFMPNPRIMKRIELERQLYDLSVICWDRGSNMLALSQKEGYTFHVIRIEAGTDPVKRFLPTIRFSKQAGKLLRQIRPDLIHVQGLDMLKIACRYKAKHPEVRIVYEVADLHRFIIDEQKNLVYKAVRKYLIHEDRALAKKYDLLIVTSEKYYEDYFSDFVPRDKMLFIPNAPNPEAFAQYRKKSGGEFVAGYIGGIRYKKQMRNLITAARQTNIKLMIAGFENEPAEIEALCRDDPDIEWIGRFDFDTQVGQLYGKCDVMYSVYDADMNNVKVALPNKLYESVYCEMPIIVAKGTALAQTVEEWGVGVAVDHRSAEDLAQVLERLKNDHAFYDSFSENCKKKKDLMDYSLYEGKLRAALVNMTE